MQPAEPAPEQSNWQVVHAISTGSTHLTIGLPCQDAVEWRILSSGILVAALADGAGTAPLAEVGANLAVTSTLSYLEDSLTQFNPIEKNAWKDLIQQAFRWARDVLAEIATKTGNPISDYATTLMCLVASQEGLALGQLGDGVLVVRTSDGTLQTLTQAQRGEYANETLFLTTELAFEHAFFQFVEMNFSGLALMSDGLIRLALQLPAYTPHAPFFNPLWVFAAKANPDDQPNQQLVDFLASERVCARTDDDKSLLIAVLPGFQFQTLKVDPIPVEPEVEG